MRVPICLSFKFDLMFPQNWAYGQYTQSLKNILGVVEFSEKTAQEIDILLQKGEKNP